MAVTVATSPLLYVALAGLTMPPSAGVHDADSVGFAGLQAPRVMIATARIETNTSAALTFANPNLPIAARQSSQSTAVKRSDRTISL